MIIWVDPARPSHKFNELSATSIYGHSVRSHPFLNISPKQIECAKISVYLQNAGSFSGVLLRRKKQHEKNTEAFGPKIGIPGAKVLDDIATPSILRREKYCKHTVEGKVLHTFWVDPMGVPEVLVTGTLFSVLPVVKMLWSSFFC